MYAIASLLDPNADTIIRGIWKRFEIHCGLTGIQSTPLPHFSWQAAEDYQVDAVEAALSQAATTLEPFSIQASGLGLFTGVRPVVYVALAKDHRMMAIHQMLWDCVHPLSTAANAYYTPSRWMPHITLAFRELDSDRLGCAVEVIAFEKIEFEIQIDNLALIYSKDGRAGIHNRVPLVSRWEDGEQGNVSAVASRLAEGQG